MMNTYYVAPAMLATVNRTVAKIYILKSDVALLFDVPPSSKFAIFFNTRTAF